MLGPIAGGPGIHQPGKPESSNESGGYAGFEGNRGASCSCFCGIAHCVWFESGGFNCDFGSDNDRDRTSSCSTIHTYCEPSRDEAILYKGPECCWS